jgi:hypothetical protein
MHNIELNTEQLEDLNLPFHIRRGLIRELQLSLPWSSLLSDSVVLQIHGLYVCGVHPSTCCSCVDTHSSLVVIGRCVMFATSLKSLSTTTINH